MDPIVIASLALEGIKLARQWQAEGKISDAEGDALLGHLASIHAQAMASYAAGSKAMRDAIAKVKG